MLDTYTPILEKEITEQESLVRNWSDIKHEVKQLLEYRIYSSNMEKYKERCEEIIFYMDEFYPITSSEIDYLPQGILAEVFFLNACKQNDIRCKPCTGDEDLKGVDFKIVNKKERKFFDVSINCNPEIVRQKISGDRSPTLFLPWNDIDNSNGVRYISFARKYIESGTFNGKEFLQRVIQSGNYRSKCLKKAIQEEKKSNSKNNVYSQYFGSSTEYIEELDSLLLLLSKSL